MEDTSGFYKIQIEYNDNIEQKLLLYGCNGVMHSDYSLLREFREIYEYPVHDWYWFDSEELAKEFYNIKE